MQYISSRGRTSAVDAANAIKMGISPDGGLFVPENIPIIDGGMLKKLATLPYQERAAYILGLFLGDFSSEEIRSCVNGAYNSENFDHEKIAPLVKLKDKLHILELWHGPTSAFKDMALQILPHLLTTSTKKTGEKKDILILVATSGDTGKAALEGFSNVEQTKIIVFYPVHGVSEVQKRQMITQTGDNVFVAAVEGNFDDAQSGVKEIFADDDLQTLLAANNLKMSSANSINWGRLLPQIVYYISAYVDLLEEKQVKTGEAINVVVPTGNFGNILAAYYAKRMGIPINKLICAANANNVLTDFIRTGVYDRNRQFEKTISPSMDILISSNLERLLFEVTGHDSQKVDKWMQELKEKGIYEVDEKTSALIQDLFWSDYSTDEETIKTISQVWDTDEYLLDTHTAVAINVYEKYLAANAEDRVTIVASTASPYKFGSSVASALIDADKLAGKDEFEILEILAAETRQVIPDNIKYLREKAILHKTISAKEELQKTVLSFLSL